MGQAKRRKQLNPNYGKPEPKVIASGNVIDEDTLKLAGAVKPPDNILIQAIVFGVQIQGIHDYKGLFMSSLQFINRGFNLAQYVFTTKQFDTILQSLINKKSLILKDGGYYIHPRFLEE